MLQRIKVWFSPETIPLKTDLLRPHTQPAQHIYDAFQVEAAKRSGREFEEWVVAERNVVFRAATEYAKKNSLTVPTMEDVERLENASLGADYGAKWSIKLANLMTAGHIWKRAFDAQP